VNTDKLIELAKLIQVRNDLETKVSSITGRPLIIGHIGEFIASELFDIELNSSANQKGYDGLFRSGHLAGKSVNIKYYSRKGRILDMNKSSSPDYYLVLMGSSEEKFNAPWDIETVYLFNTNELTKDIEGKVNIGTATSIRKELWRSAMVYPEYNNTELLIEEEKREVLKQFSLISTY